MRVESLSLKQFRLYNRKAFNFSSGINVFAGGNALGKTTVLEGIFLCSLGKSFRTTQITDLIQHETEYFSVEISFDKSEISQENKVFGSSEEKYAFVSGEKQSLSTLVGGLLAVVSLTEDILLVKSSPALRRDYLDQLLLQIDPFYGHHLKRYLRALKQRNSALRHSSWETLETWEYELAHSAVYLINRRKKSLENLSKLYERIYNQLSGRDCEIFLRYKCGINYTEPCFDSLRSIWKSSRERDIHAGATLVGPHKDNFVICLREMDLRHFGSEGEQRTAALALRLAEYELMLKENEGDKPILLIDDMGYGLDKNRQMNLVRWVQKNAGQVFITTNQNELFGMDTHINVFSY